MEVCRTVKVELFKQLVKPPVNAAGFRKRSGIDQIVVAPLHRKVMGVQPVHIHKTKPLRVILGHLVNGEAVPLMGKKCPFPFFLMVQAVLHPRIELRAFLPFLAGNGIHGPGGLGVKFLPVKQHFRRFLRVNGCILNQQHIAGVQSCVHLHNSHAGLCFAV